MSTKSRAWILAGSISLVASLVSEPIRADGVDEHAIFRLDGTTSFQQLGVSLSHVPDVDGDLVPDILAGVRTERSPLPNGQPGVSAVVYSGRTRLPLFTVPAPDLSAASYNVVAGLGDLNDDGRPEFVVGTPGARGAGGAAREGVARVFDSSGALLKTYRGSGAGALFGASVASAGNVDAHRLPDFIVGAPGVGLAYVLSGNLQNAPLATLDGLDKEGRFGASVGSAGNIDGVPGAELLVGSPYSLSDNGQFAGAVRVFTASRPTEPIFTRFGDGPFAQLGSAVVGGLDLNADGTPDFVGGAIGTLVDAITGSVPGTGYVRAYSGSDGQPLLTVASEEPGDLFGFSLALTRLCSGRPTALLIGAPAAHNPELGFPTGRVDIFDAGSGSSVARLLGGGFLDALGFSVAPFVDPNGDGSFDFLAGARARTSGSLPNAGAAYVLSCGPVPRPELTATPVPLFFATLPPGSSQSKDLLLENAGTGDLVVTGIALAPGSSPAFSVSGSTAFTIPPQGSRPVPVRFSPTTATLHSGSLEVVSEGPGDPFLFVGVFGKSVRPGIEVTPAAISLGTVDVGEPAWATLRVGSSGNQALTVSGVRVVGGVPGDYRLVGLPSLPLELPPGQSFSAQLRWIPSQGGSGDASVEVSSNAPVTPLVSVPVDASGVARNEPPVASIRMDVPYTDSERTVQFHGEGSLDPDGTIVAYHWDFGHEGQTSTAASPGHTFPAFGAFEVRLRVTDDGGKSDSTSITAVTLGGRNLRCRFWGTVQQGGLDVPAGTMVEAWTDGQKVAEAIAQVHLGQSVFAIEVRQASALGTGGENGETVTFKYGNVTAHQTGTWWRGTDQELDLTAPAYFPLRAEPWCRKLGLQVEICGGITARAFVADIHGVPAIPGSIDPLVAVHAFRLDFFDHGSGEPIDEFDQPYRILTRYTAAQIAAAGAREASLQLHVLTGEGWRKAGEDQLDAAQNLLVTTLTRTGTFALVGEATGARGRLAPGDCNVDGRVDVSDALCLLGFLFRGSPQLLPCGDGTSADRGNDELVNWNADGAVDLSDAVGLLRWLFTGGPPHALAAPGAPDGCIEIDGCPISAACRP